MYRRVVDVNLTGVLNGVHCAMPLLRRRAAALLSGGDDTTGGAAQQLPQLPLIFTTSSGAAVSGMAGNAVYAATKGAVRYLTESLSVELHAEGIRVGDVLPGWVATGMTANLPQKRYKELQRLGIMNPPSTIAERVLQCYDGPQGGRWRHTARTDVVTALAAAANSSGLVLGGRSFCFCLRCSEERVASSALAAGACIAVASLLVGGLIVWYRRPTAQSLALVPERRDDGPREAGRRQPRCSP